MSELPATMEYEHTSWSEDDPLCAQLKRRADAMRDELLARIAEMRAENKRLKHEVEVLTRLRPYANYEWPTVLELERGRKQAEAKGGRA